MRIMADKNRREFGNTKKAQQHSRAERKATRVEAHARASYKQKVISSRINDLMEDLNNIAIG